EVPEYQGQAEYRTGNFPQYNKYENYLI
ncbi:MAG: hypothetical protein PWQ17_981, partial [Anaerophaga sp.]|nr:hypothetical protein [Anaerophaga sp.]